MNSNDNGLDARWKNVASVYRVVLCLTSRRHLLAERVSSMGIDLAKRELEPFPLISLDDYCRFLADSSKPPIDLPLCSSYWMHVRSILK